MNELNDQNDNMSKAIGFIALVLTVLLLTPLVIKLWAWAL